MNRKEDSTPKPTPNQGSLPATDLPMRLEVERDGRTHAGEAVFAERWDKKLGVPPPPGIAFRLVFLTQPATVDPAQVQSARVVVFLPGETVGGVARVAEAPAIYAAGKNTAGLALTAKVAEAYSLGSIFVGSHRGPDPASIFAGDDDDIPLANLARLADLEGLAPEIARVRSYLEDARPPESDEELYLDRLSLLEQLSAERIFRNPAPWSSIQALFDLFKSRYVGAYVKHHRQYRAEVAGLSEDLAKALPKVSALRLLNGIEELGTPQGESALVVAEGLAERLNPCGRQDIDLSLQIDPLCPTCRTPMDTASPTQLVKRTLTSLDGALGTQMARLSQQAVTAALRRPGDPTLEQFLRVVLAADLVGLAQVMDEELAKSLKRLLGEVDDDLAQDELHRKLRERFPEMGVEQTAAFGEAMAGLLDEAAEGASSLNPGKRIRLRIV